MTKRITANLPDDLVRQAMPVMGKGVTDTIIEGFRRVCQGLHLCEREGAAGQDISRHRLEVSRERVRG